MNEYDDIINLPHHVSATRKHMSISDRAAQFSPFSALTGHDDAIKETARLTDRQIELDEYTKAELDRKICYLGEHLSEKPSLTITYFKPDTTKSGGAYITECCFVKKIDVYENAVILFSGDKIPIDSIINIDGEIYDDFDI